MAKKKKITKYIGMHLYPWQQAVVDYICNARGTGRVCVTKAPRQRGKTYLTEGVLLHYAINYAKSTNAMISPTLAQSRKVFKEIVNGIFRSGIIAKKNETLLEIELINGSTIFFKSSEMGDGLRGFHIDGILILDEAAYLTDDILELILPWRQVSNAPMLLVSSPKIRQGAFYSYWVQGIEDGVNVKSIDWCDWDTSCMITEEMIKQYKKVMTANQFKSEILGEWLDDDGMVFTNITSNVMDYEVTASTYYYGGIDFGAGNTGDYTSLTIFNEKGEMVFIDYFNDLGTFQQVDRLISDLTPFLPKMKKIYGSSLEQIILYGSYARGEETSESDVDIAVILKQAPEEEIHDSMTDMLVDYELDLGITISAVTLDSGSYSQWMRVLPFYMNIAKEGIVLWKAA